MDAAEETRAAQAASADEDGLVPLLHDPSPQVIRALLENRHLREVDILVIANRKNLPPDVFALIAKDPRCDGSYPIRLALAKNPKTPLPVSLTIVRHLRLFDIAEMTRSHLLSPAFRHKVEAIVMERIPSMPLGYKKTLAKMAVGNVLLKLLQDPDEEVVMLCLNNPRLLESHLFKTISRKDTPAGTIQLISGHPNWSGRSLIRYALVRNELTPLALSERFLQSMKLLELRELHADTLLPVGVKPLVQREFLARGMEPASPTADLVFEIDENDDVGMENMEGIEEEAPSGE
jgi:hypothetical protein